LAATVLAIADIKAIAKTMVNVFFMASTSKTNDCWSGIYSLLASAMCGSTHQGVQRGFAAPSAGITFLAFLT
jgi:hypothetical protein